MRFFQKDSSGKVLRKILIIQFYFQSLKFVWKKLVRRTFVLRIIFPSYLLLTSLTDPFFEVKTTSAPISFWAITTFCGFTSSFTISPITLKSPQLIFTSCPSINVVRNRHSHTFLLDCAVSGKNNKLLIRGLREVIIVFQRRARMKQEGCKHCKKELFKPRNSINYKGSEFLQKK